MKNKAVFLDRDGTINIDKGYVYKIEDFEFIPGAIEAIKLLNDNDFKVIVVTNQAGIARGYYKEDDVYKLHDYINEELAKHDARIDAFYFCPHHPTAGIGKYKVDCKCRKPNSGLLEKASIDFDIELSKSWIIGDKKSDIQAGANVGCQGVLIAADTTESLIIKGSCYVKANNLYHAVCIIDGKG